MNSCLDVLSPGLFTTLQDLGRFGFEDVGVPPSGAMDEMSFAIANALVGNPSEAGSLEFTLTGATLLLRGDSPCDFAVTGDMALTVDNQPISTYQLHRLFPGQTLKIIRALSGARGYLAVAGGFNVKPMMGSVSTLMRAGLGGFNGRQLLKGDMLPLTGSPLPPFDVNTQPVQRILPQQERRPIRVILGPQDDNFDSQTICAFLNNRYRVSEQSDRMGFRLSGNPLTHTKGFNIVSDAIARGSIQIPGNGQPIIAMNDRQTTGGYPKIATVIRADLARLGQLKPGDSLSFESVTMDKAESLWRGRQKMLNDWLASLRSAVLPVGE